jgi:hypothetical protein
MSNPDNNFDFAGAGFILLSLDIGTTSSGSLTDGSGFQPLSNITFDGTTGAISFAVAESPTIGVRNIKFSGNVINDGSGNAIGFTGTWQGLRVPVIVEESATADAQSAPAKREEPAIGVAPPVFFDVQGLWAAVVDRDEIT